MSDRQYKAELSERNSVSTKLIPLRSKTRFDNIFRNLIITENAIAVIVTAVMILLPIASMLCRRFFGFSITGSLQYLQHSTLWITFVGAALASRDRKHLKLSTGMQLTGIRFIKGVPAKVINIFHASVSVSVIMTFAVAGYFLVVIEKGNNTVVAPFLPTWIAQIPIPLFAAVTGLHFLHRAKVDKTSKILIALLAVAILCVGLVPEQSRSFLLVPGIILLVLSGIAGSPIFVLLGGAAMLFFFIENVPITVVPAEAYRLVSSPVLPTIPLFTLAGYVMAEGGAARRLVGFFRAAFGWIPGGIAIATIVVCAFFTTFTGASGVTILALGGILYPVLLKEKYGENFSLGLITASGSVGILFAPALPIILYGVMAHVPINKLFVAGILPGLLLVVLMSVYGIFVFKKRNISSARFSYSALIAAAKTAKWDLLIPFIVFFGIFGGFATFVETAALTAFYAIILECVIHKDLKFSSGLLKGIIKSATLVGGILIILGLAFGFTSYLIDAGIPDIIFEWIKANISSKIVFLMLLNIFLIFTGCIMDIFSSIVVVVPVIVPVAAAYGIHPVHLGIIFLVNLELGYLTPPVGLNLFLSAYRFGKPLSTIYKTIWPFLAIRGIVVLMVTYLPWISLLFVE